MTVQNVLKSKYNKNNNKVIKTMGSDYSISEGK